MDEGGLGLPLRRTGGAVERLTAFLETEMTMSHVYQPVMVRTILEGGGAATRRQIAAAFLAADLSQLEYYENVVSRYPGPVLRRWEIVEHERGVYRLTRELSRMDEWQRARLIALCDVKVAEFVARRQSAIWAHRSANSDPVPGTLRYRIIARAMGRCEACGVSSQVRALEVDHIVPREKQGSNELSNLQALCSLCNVQKLNRDQTDFHAAHEAIAYRHLGCAICDRIDPASDELAFALEGSDHPIVVPRRHGADWLTLWQPEVNALRRTEAMAGISSATMTATMTGAVDGDAGHLVLSYAS